MNFDLQVTFEQITSNVNFLKLKNIIENNSYHDHESVYDHLIKTYGIAKDNIDGNIITGVETKKLFTNYVNQEIDEIKKRDLMLIFALIHDIGKMIIFERNGKQESIMQVNEKGTTQAPYHEYFGSLIVKDVLSETGLSEKVINYLSKCVRLHGLFNGTWINNKDLDANGLLEILKMTGENIHVEQIFNGMCDCFTAPPFQEAKPVIFKIFNNPNFYSTLKYSIMD